MYAIRRVTSLVLARTTGSAIVAAGGILVLSTAVAAQDGPPINGLTGRVALEGTVEQEYAGANAVMVKTADGVRYLFHFTKNLLVHGSKGTGVDALKGLLPGTTVAVHYTVSDGEAAAQEIDRVGDDGLESTEGTVVRIDRGRKQIAIRFDDGKTETFRLSESAAQDAGRDLDTAASAAGRVTVYYTDESGQRVVHFFNKALQQ
jgi:hypothetical protein